MNILSTLTYTSFIVYLAFGIYILYLNRKETINRIFALLSFVLAVWSLADSFYYTAPDKDTAMIFWRISTVGWVLSPAFMLHLMLLVGKFRKFTDRWYKILTIYIPAVVLEILALTTKFYLEDIFITPYGWADLIDPDSVTTISFLTYYCTYSLLSLIAVYIWGKNSPVQQEKKQAAIIFIVSLISLMPSFFTNTMQIAYGVDFQIPSFAEVFILIWVGGIMYAIKRYNFLAREEEISELNEKIMLEKKIVAIQSEYIKNQNYILETLFDYFKKNPSDDIYYFIADRIYQTGGIKLLMITEYDMHNSKFTLKSLRCENTLEEEFRKLISSYLISSEADIIKTEKELILQKLLSSHIIKLGGGLYEGILRTIDKEKIVQFSERHSLGDAYSIGFSSGNNLYGAVTIIVEKDKILENTDFLEILINVLSLILQKWHADTRLKKSEELHRAIFEYSDDCIYILDQRGNILSVSPSFERITGYKISDFINKSMAEIIHPEDIEESFSMLRNVINSQTPLRKVIRIINSKNEIMYGEFAATKFILDSGETALLGIGRDVTERIRNEELIKSYQKELELKTTKIETAGLMAAGVLHDLNNILMNISSKVDKIKKINLPDTEINHYVTDIDRTLEMAKRLSRSLFNISGGKVPEDSDSSLRNIIKENLHLLVREPKYQVNTDIPENIPDIALSYSHFTQIFNNLVINAVQAMPDGGTIMVSASEKDINNRRFISLSVSDTGKGIPEEFHGKIFEPFFTTKPEGTGLGLPTVKSLIKSYGGEIEFSSVAGRGTTFTVLIPVRTDSKIKAEPKEESKSGNNNKITTVLITDDDANIRELAVEMLKHLGFSAFSASDSTEAFNFIKTSPIDAVILDLHLKDKSDALQTLKQIREMKTDIKVIACSGSPNDSFLTRYSSYGFDGALSKPFNLKDLQNALK